MATRRAVSGKTKFAVLLSAALTFASVAPASAGLFDPAYRGDINSIHAIFTWVSGQADWNTTLFETGPSLFPLAPTIPLANDDGLDTTVDLPNFIDLLPLKLMRIQLSFNGMVSGDLIAADLLAFDPQPTSWSVVGNSGPGDATNFFIDIEIMPNPDSEQITIFGNAVANIIPGNLIEIEIDTISIPEPSTLSLLILGGLAVLRRRR